MSPEVVQAVTDMEKEVLPPTVDQHSISLGSPSTGALQEAFARAARKRSKQLKQQMRDANLRENFKPCRKNKCGKFKERSCFFKSFEQQKKCWENKDYEKPEENPPAQENAQ